MDTSVKGLNKWANSHTYYPLDFVRIGLGVFLFMKGVSVFTHHTELEDSISPFSNFMGGMWVLHYVALAHLLGGVLIVFGLLTRWSLIIQLPILFGAIAINFFGIMNVQNLLMALLALVVSVFFIFYGGGRHSADYFYKMQK